MCRDARGAAWRTALANEAKPLRWRLAGFDLDGTLVYGDTVLLHVGRQLGEERLVHELVSGYEAFELTNFEVSNRAARIFAGLTKGELFKIMEGISTLDDISSSIGFLRTMGVRCLIATVTFDFASEWFARRYGFDYYNGIQLAYSDAGTLTGEVLRHVDEEDKARFVRSRATAAGVDLGDVFYVGDSRSDLPTFDTVGFSVAVNGSQLAAAAAKASVKTRSLRAVLDLVPGLSDQRLG